MELSSRAAPAPASDAQNESALATMRFPANGENCVVSVCGRHMEVSQECLSSVWLLRNELVGKLSVSGPASLQLADSVGTPIRIDEELSVAVRAGHYPLQVTLTDMALHEIENKKLEGENKKQEMSHLQWQIVREQLKHFSGGLADVVSQLHTVRDFCQRTMQEFEDQEELRGERTIAAIVQEASEREAVQQDLAARVDKLAQMIAEERTVREVQHLQLAKQSEIQTSEIESVMTSAAKDQSETARAIQSMRHELDLEAQKRTETLNRLNGQAKRLEAQLDESKICEKDLKLRATESEGNLEKLRVAMQSLEMEFALERRNRSEDLGRKTEEIGQKVNEEISIRKSEVAKLVAELEMTGQVMQDRAHRAREELGEVNKGLMDRVKAVETRCGDLEQDSIDRKRFDAARSIEILDNFTETQTTVETIHVEHRANDTLVQTASSRMDWIVERLNLIEKEIEDKAPKVHVDAYFAEQNRATEFQVKRLAQTERELREGLAAEAANRENATVQLAGTMRTCFDVICKEEQRGKLPVISINAADYRAQVRSQPGSPNKAGTMEALTPEQQAQRQQMLRQMYLQQQQQQEQRSRSPAPPTGQLPLPQQAGAVGSTTGSVAVGPPGMVRGPQTPPMPLPGQPPPGYTGSPMMLQPGQLTPPGPLPPAAMGLAPSMGQLPVAAGSVAAGSVASPPVQ